MEKGQRVRRGTRGKGKFYSVLILKKEGKRGKARTTRKDRSGFPGNRGKRR